jgi:hypothetical protein
LISLTDIVPQKRAVQTAAGELELRGLGLRQIADLFLQFMTLRDLFTENDTDVTITQVALQAPDAVAAIVAEAAGQPDAAAVVAGGALSPDEILDCLEAIYELTFPRGVSPLLERVAVLLRAGGLVVGRSGRAPDTNVPPLPNGSSPPDMTVAK